jgi:hypothetical protein
MDRARYVSNPQVRTAAKRRFKPLEFKGNSDPAGRREKAGNPCKIEAVANTLGTAVQHRACAESCENAGHCRGNGWDRAATGF